MKIWFGHGSEHSANLVIIGEFKTEDDAIKIERLITNATAIAESDSADGIIEAGKPVSRFSDGFMEMMSRENFHAFNYKDPEQLLYGHEVERDGQQIVITTEEDDVSALLKMLIAGSARVQVYSAHDYPSLHGRQTHQDS